MPIKKPDIGWLAGIIDGEGSIVFHPQRNGYHLCRIIIVNTDEGILNEVKRILNEWLVFYSFYARKAYPNRKQVYSIEVNRLTEACFVLNQIKPFLKSAKQEKIKLLIDYMERKDALGRRKNLKKRSHQYSLESL